MSKAAAAVLSVSLAAAGALGYAQSTRQPGAAPLVKVVPAKPFSCLIAGDSTALAAGKLIPECSVEAGYRTAVRDIGLPGTTTLIVLSIGDAGRHSPTLLADVAALRARAGKRRVVWVLPANLATRAAVQAVANANGDPTVTLPLDARRYFHR